MSVSMDEMNFLIWRYMQENGFPHSAFVFDTESFASNTNIPGAQIPPGALITLLQKSLIYLKIEKAIRAARSGSNSKVGAEIAEISRMFPNTVPDAAALEGIDPVQLTPDNSTFLQSGNRAAIAALAWSPDGDKLGVLHADGSGAIWVSRCRERIAIGRAGSSIPRTRSSLSWNSSSELIAVCEDSATTIFNLNGEAVVTIPVASSVVVFSPTDLVLMTCSRSDFSVAVWGIRGEAAAPIHRFESHRAQVLDIAASADGQSFATGSADKAVGLFRSSGSAQMLRGHTLEATAVVFSRDGQRLASGGNDGAVFVWKDGRQASVMKGHAGGISAIAWHPGGKLIASGSIDGSCRVWDVDSGDCQSVMARHRQGLTALAFYPRADYLLTGGRDGIVGIWKWQEAKMIAAFSCGGPVGLIRLGGRDAELAAVGFDTPVSVIIPIAQYLE
jgi:transducin (beta)-like 1